LTFIYHFAFYSYTDYGLSIVVLKMMNTLMMAWWWWWWWWCANCHFNLKSKR